MTQLSGRKAKRIGTILVLDDDPGIRHAITRALELAGHRVMTAASAAEAFAKESSWEGEIDLLVCDLVMPGLGGREAANALLARRPGMRVLYISGFSSRGSFRKELSESGFSFMGKPFEIIELLEAVNVTLEGGQWHPLGGTNGTVGVSS